MAETRRATVGARRATVLAATAAACTAGGLAAVLVAVAAGPGSGLTGYVSEAGSAGAPCPGLYRLGMLALAGALLLLAGALPVALRLAAGLLAAGAAATVTSAAVPCSAGCPLPPYEPTTVADVVHGAVSIGAVAASVFAMLAVAFSPWAARPLRRLGGLAAAVALPLSATAGLALLLVGRGPLIALVERVLLLDIAAWVLASAVLIGLRNGAGVPAPDEP
ncbi:DUF998 domain-containing protein [Micromonospora sp. NPDC049559]|uniref:DUF998 domain-containing protein n=1 Tax=Micromonospora sp. NPDC049559 TaxID=3155923 RepID=UPI003418440D